MADLVRGYLQRAGLRRPLVPVRLPGKIARAVKDGANLPGRRRHPGPAYLGGVPGGAKILRQQGPRRSQQRKIMIIERSRLTPNGPIPCLRWLPITVAEVVRVGADQPQAEQADVFRRPLLAG